MTAITTAAAETMKRRHLFTFTICETWISCFNICAKVYENHARLLMALKCCSWGSLNNLLELDKIDNGSCSNSALLRSYMVFLQALRISIVLLDLYFVDNPLFVASCNSNIMQFRMTHNDLNVWRILAWNSTNISFYFNHIWFPWI